VDRVAGSIRYVFILIVFGFSLIPPAAAKSARVQAGWAVTAQPSHLVNGSPVLFRVSAPQRLAALKATWLEHEITFRYKQSCKCWYAIAGVPLETKPGDYPLNLEGERANGDAVNFAKELNIDEAQYPATALKVAPEYVEPPKETLVRIEQEQTVKKDTFSHSISDALWAGPFLFPAKASVSGVFGSARVFNGVKRNQHQGLDFRVHTGTPIHAANAGKVVLARNLYFEGNCVAIDHGQGLMTLYLHLSQFKVKEGDQVRKGQLLGLSGGTGRATAPHLHFAVRWQGEYLNPATLLKLTPP
jgi:murein DD-endopeptidase MepM/ murein hydrolase activator NlpD